MVCTDSSNLALVWGGEFGVAFWEGWSKFEVESELRVDDVARLVGVVGYSCKSPKALVAVLNMRCERSSRGRGSRIGPGALVASETVGGWESISTGNPSGRTSMGWVILRGGRRDEIIPRNILQGHLARIGHPWGDLCTLNHHEYYSPKLIQVPAYL